MEDYSNISNDETISPTKEPPLSPIDAVINVSISNNKNEAYLCIDPPMNGGVPPTPKVLEDALVSRKIIYGVNTEKLKEIAENPIYNKIIIIAQGIMPENGVNGTYAFQFKLEKNYKPKERQDGTVDYRNLDIVENVRKGQSLCIITNPTDGTEGISVTGEKLLPVKGKAVPSFVGKNTEFSEDGTVIYSKIDGQVEYDGRKINVSETLFVQGNVDNATGNFKVVGNVVIKGTVFPKFVVEASGNIEIYDTVESAILKADKNIILRSGIIGSELSCKGDLTSKFIENSNVFVNGDIVAEFIINSNVKCGKSLQLIGSKGKILGGSCVAGQDIVARTIGSNAGVGTDLTISTNPNVIDRQQELVKQLPSLEKQISSLKSLISLLQQFEAANRLTPEKKMTLDKALSSYETCIALFESGNQELLEINASLQTKGNGKVICSGTIFPGTIIKIRSAKIYVTNVLSSTSLYYNEGYICQGPVH
jgi:uncharacterized protein (DUF342 family)